MRVAAGFQRRNDQVRLEEGVIIQKVSRDLYANPKSGFREFYNIHPFRFLVAK